MIPESMKYVYRIMVDFYEKLEEEFVNEGRSGCGFHLKKAVKTTKNNLQYHFVSYLHMYIFRPDELFTIS